VAAASAWPTVLVGRVVDRFGKGVRSAPRDALISASVPPEALGRAFGFHRAGDSLGAVIGPILGLAALAAMDDNLHKALWFAVIPATLSALLVVLVHEPPRPAAAAVEAAGSVERPAPRRARSPLPHRFWQVSAALTLVALVNFPDTLILLRVIDLGAGTTQEVIAYVLFNVVYTLGSYPAGALADRWPQRRVYGVGLLAFGVGYLGLGLAHGGAAVYLLVAVYGLFPALTDGVGKAWISSIVPPEYRGRAQGVFQGLNSAAILVAGTVAGLAWDAGPGDGVVPLLVSGAVGLAAGALMLGYRRTGTGARAKRTRSSPGPSYPGQ